MEKPDAATIRKKIMGVLLKNARMRAGMLRLTTSQSPLRHDAATLVAAIPHAAAHLDVLAYLHRGRNPLRLSLP